MECYVKINIINERIDYCWVIFDQTGVSMLNMFVYIVRTQTVIPM